MKLIHPSFVSLTFLSLAAAPATRPATRPATTKIGEVFGQPVLIGSLPDGASTRQSLLREKLAPRPPATISPRPIPERRADAWAALEVWRDSRTWRPHQLRHNAATMLGRAFAIGTVGVVLGHPSPAVTEVYIEAGRTSADRAMAQVG